jgi:hypothetical protein
MPDTRRLQMFPAPGIGSGWFRVVKPVIASTLTPG